MKRIYFIFYIFSLIVSYSLAGISPEKGWRYQPSEWNSNPSDSSLNQIMEGKDCTWKTGISDSWIALRLPATDKPISLMWTYGGILSKSSTHVILEMSPNSKNGENGHWMETAEQTPKHFLEKFMLSTSTVECWYRLRDAHRRTSTQDAGRVFLL